LQGVSTWKKNYEKLAIERYLKGESSKTIYNNLSRSKFWFFKWLKRYQSGDPNWFVDRSRAPLNRPLAINPAARKRIVTRLVSTAPEDMNAQAFSFDV
jgi:hypothetical protein